MRSHFPRLLALTLAVLVAGPALAQRPGGGRFAPEGPALLGNKSVQDELKLTDDQKAAIKKVMDEGRAAMRKAFQDMDRDAARAAREKMGKELAKVKEGLKPDQAKRFKQIQLQVAGPRALASPEVQKELKLTDKQTEEVKGIFKDLQAKRQELFKDAGGDREKMREAFRKMQEMSKTANEKLGKVLTPDQQKKLEQLKGPKFEIKFERPRRRE